VATNFCFQRLSKSFTLKKVSKMNLVVVRHAEGLASRSAMVVMEIPAAEKSV
jgi:hypothetical protein